MTQVSVTLKVATSMDGRIALADGTSQWITGSDARARVHKMRAEHDAVLVGIGTVLADDPMLTARTVPLPDTQPVRIVADSNGRTPVGSRLMKSVGTGRVVIATGGQPQDILARAGADVWRCGDDGMMDPAALIDRCAAEGLTKVFLEGGGTLAASFLRLGLVDTLHWFRAPIIIGGGMPSVRDIGLAGLDEAHGQWDFADRRILGKDSLEIYDRAA